MSDLTRSLAMSASAMQAQTTRLRHVSENIANADTPGYRRKTISFEPRALPGESMGDASGVRASRPSLDPRDLERVYDPGHILADETGHYDGSNVNTLLEMADAREAQRSYDANLRMFDLARQMSQGVIGLLRR